MSVGPGSNSNGALSYTGNKGEYEIESQFMSQYMIMTSFDRSNGFTFKNGVEGIKHLLENDYDDIWNKRNKGTQNKERYVHTEGSHNHRIVLDMKNHHLTMNLEYTGHGPVTLPNTLLEEADDRLNGHINPLNGNAQAKSIPEIVEMALNQKSGSKYVGHTNQTWDDLLDDN